MRNHVSSCQNWNARHSVRLWNSYPGWRTDNCTKHRWLAGNSLGHITGPCNLHHVVSYFYSLGQGSRVGGNCQAGNLFHLVIAFQSMCISKLSFQGKVGGSVPWLETFFKGIFQSFPGHWAHKSWDAGNSVPSGRRKKVPLVQDLLTTT